MKNFLNNKKGQLPFGLLWRTTVFWLEPKGKRLMRWQVREVPQTEVEVLSVFYVF